MNKSKSLGELNKRMGNSNHQSSQKTPSSSGIQWRVWLGLIFMILMTFMDWQWAWGILFLVWVIPDIRDRVTYFIEPVERDNNPVLYWAIVGTWIILSLFSLSTLFVDYTQYY